MPKLESSDVELRCIGILLDRCGLPVKGCRQCWFARDNGTPTLVAIAVFKRIHSQVAYAD